MKIVNLALILYCFICANAFANQQRDLSMSVEETLREQSNQAQAGPKEKFNNSGTGFDDSVEIDPNLANQLRAINQRELEREIKDGRTYDVPVKRGGTQGFMASFCSSTSAPQIRFDSATQTCQESQRQQACERFRHATIDVQRLLDRAINCEYISGGGEQSAAECDGLDAGRLDLLKQYWQDEESSYTILFLPDMVLNSAVNCSAKTIRKTGLPK